MSTLQEKKSHSYFTALKLMESLTIFQNVLFLIFIIEIAKFPLLDLNLH